MPLAGAAGKLDTVRTERAGKLTDFTLWETQLEIASPSVQKTPGRPVCWVGDTESAQVPKKCLRRPTVMNVEGSCTKKATHVTAFQPTARTPHTEHAFRDVETVTEEHTTG